MRKICYIICVMSENVILYNIKIYPQILNLGLISTALSIQQNWIY
jgi:hypothetical protein